MLVEVLHSQNMYSVLLFIYMSPPFHLITVFLRSEGHRRGSSQQEGGLSLQLPAGVRFSRAQQEQNCPHAKLQQLAKECPHR